MYEHHRAPLLPRPAFLARVARGALLAGVVVIGSLSIGVAGYHFIARLSYVDALLNAAMILTGMGPVDPMPTTGAKLFAAAYALFSGVAFLTFVALLLTPVVHRMLHRFHIEGDEKEGRDRRREG